MKKALALILALIMLCSSATMIAFAADDAGINIEEMPGYNKTYIGAPLGEKDTKPQQDGTIGDDEYTFVREAKYMPSDKYKMDSTIKFKECFAYDDEFIYYAVSYPEAYWSTKQFFFVRLTQDYIISSTPEGHTNQYMSDSQYGLRLVTHANSAYTNAKPSGKDYPTSDEYVYAVNRTTKEGAYGPVAFELKISRKYLAKQMGLGEDPSKVTKLFYSFYMNDSAFDSPYAAGGRWGYISCDHMLTDEQDEWLKAQGVTTSLDNSVTNGTALNRLYNMVVLDDEPEKPDDRLDLQQFYADHGYASTYVGKALTDGDTKPVQDGVIDAGEYQKEYIVNKDGTHGGSHVAMRHSALVDLKDSYRECISHDKDWIYVAFEFVSGTSKPRFYWNLSFIDSFKFIYNGGSTIKEAFTQNGHGINDGWFYGGGINGSNVLGHYNNTASIGKAPSIGSDVYVTINQDAPTSSTQVYEFKISKAWYAAQVGIAAEDVRELAWVTLPANINSSNSSYTQIGHYLTDEELTTLENTYGKTYTRPVANDKGSHPYDNASLPRLIILDEPDTDWEKFADDNNLTVKVKPVTEVPKIDGIIGATEYPTTITTDIADIYNTNGNGELEGTTITEYFGHDAEYIYYALSFKQTSNGSNGRACIVNFKPNNTFDVFNENYNDRAKYQARYNEDKDGNTVNFTNGIEVLGASWAKPVDETDMFFAAEKDRETNIKTYEFKISKAYIAVCAGVGMDDISVVPYYVSFHDVCMLGGTFTSDLKKAIASAGGDIPNQPEKVPCYRFMSLEDGDLLKVEDRLAITTQETASIRLSMNQPGLRFKSVISTSDLKALMSKYDYIKVGTLIAPENFGLTLQGILENTAKKDGVDYINVEANINTPFGYDRNINVFAGSITNLHENNIARDFEAVGYIAYSEDGVEWTYVYSDVTAVRSAAFVAYEAIESDDYKDDAAALAILNKYAAKYEAN